MRLNNIFDRKPKKPAPELFLAVEIHESMIKSAVWQVENETPSVVSLGSYELWDSEESLVNGVDASLTEAIKGLDSEPDRVIFGLPDSWQVGDKVHPSKINLIKRLRVDLKLKPIGMVTISDAIVTYLKSQEGIPPTAILLEVNPFKVNVSLVNVGRIDAREEVGRSDDLPRDIEEGLARFEVDKLPPRFILTNGSELENESQAILSYPWTDKLPFMHDPKVQTLPIDFSIRAIALAGGSEAAKSLGVEVVAPSEPEPATPPTEEFLPESPVEAEPASAFEESLDADEASTDLASIGFTTEGDNFSQIEINESPPGSENNFAEPETAQVKPVAKKIHLPKFSAPRISLPSFAIPKFAFLLVPVVAFFLIVGGVWGFYNYIGKATVQVTISSKKITQTFDLAISTADVPGKLTLIGTKKTLSAKASDSTNTSGEAVVGDKAVGKITIYNRTAGPLNLKAGTKLTAASGQVFTLDAATTVASSSSQIDSNYVQTITPGTATANISAAKIGAEFNLDKNQQFSLDTYPKASVVASNDSPLTGGSSRTVKAANKADQDRLLAQVTEKIKTDIASQISNNNPDQKVVPLGNVKYTTKNFSNNPGEEAVTLGLDLEGNMDVLAYSQSSLTKILADKILASAPSGSHLTNQPADISVSDPVQTADGTLISRATITVSITPDIDTLTMASRYAGKTVDALKEYLITLPGFESSIMNPPIPLPYLKRYLPKTAKNISFNISYK